MAKQSSYELYLKVGADGTLKVGTCEHCVIKEPKRPDRAWNPNGDRELDFDRDMLIQQLADLGVQVTIVQEYVCP